MSLESSGEDELVDGGVNKLVDARLDTNSDSIFLTHGDFGDNMIGYDNVLEGVSNRQDYTIKTNSRI